MWPRASSQWGTQAGRQAFSGCSQCGRMWEHVLRAAVCDAACVWIQVQGFLNFCLSDKCDWTQTLGPVGQTVALCSHTWMKMKRRRFLVFHHFPYRYVQQCYILCVFFNVLWSLVLCVCVCVLCVDHLSVCRSDCGDNQSRLEGGEEESFSPLLHLTRPLWTLLLHWICCTLYPMCTSVWSRKH